MVTGLTDASINLLVRFCACRDVSALTRHALVATAGRAADVAVLFGGSILAGADVFAGARREGVASRYLIVGGQGHTTDALRGTLREHMGWDDVASSTEAVLFTRHLWEHCSCPVTDRGWDRYGAVPVTGAIRPF